MASRKPSDTAFMMAFLRGFHAVYDNWGKTITEATIKWCEETIQVLQENGEDDEHLF